MFYVNEKIQITDTDRDISKKMFSVIGLDDEGTLNKISVGKGLDIINNTIISVSSGYYYTLGFTLVTPSTNTQSDKLNLGITGDYSHKNVISLKGKLNLFKFPKL